MFGAHPFGKAKFAKAEELSEVVIPPPVEQPVCDWDTLQRLTRPGQKKKRKPIALVQPAPAQPRSVPVPDVEELEIERERQEREEREAIEVIALMIALDAEADMREAAAIAKANRPLVRRRGNIDRVTAELRAERWAFRDFKEKAPAEA